MKYVIITALCFALGMFAVNKIDKGLAHAKQVKAEKVQTLCLANQ